MRARFGVERNQIRPGIRESLQIGINRGDHQMHIKGDGGVAAQRLDQRWPKGDVRDEMPIHNVQMQPIRACCGHGTHFLTEFGEIGGQKRRGDERRGLHDSPCNLANLWGQPCQPYVRHIPVMCPSPAAGGREPEWATPRMRRSQARGCARRR